MIAFPGKGNFQRTRRLRRRGVFAAFLLGSIQITQAQTFDKLHLHESCNYTGGILNQTVTTFGSIREADEIIEVIVSQSGLAKNFEVQSGTVPNAAAVVHDETRYIIYNPEFIDQMNAGAKTEWAAKSVLAHEIGHHLNGHTLSAEGSRPAKELEADYYSGLVLQRMGAREDEALAAMRKFGSTKATPTHPAKYQRLAAISSGWKRACDLDANCSGLQAQKSNDQKRKYVVQLLASQSEEQAVRSFNGLKRRYSRMLRGRSHKLERAIVNGQAYFRIVIPAEGFGLNEASIFCGDLRSAGADCFLREN